jgi:hypothetical protein
MGSCEGGGVAKFDMSNIKIEDGIPIPTERGNQEFKAIARTMKVGQSVYVADRNQSDAMRHALYSVYGKGTARTRQEANGYRVWRVASI